jgi:hypothetical protein
MNLENRLRSELKERLNGLHARPEDWSKVVDRLGRSERRARSVRFVGAVLTVSIFLIVYVLLTRAFDSAGEFPRSDVGLLEDELQIGSTIALPGPGTTVAADAGAVWVAIDRQDSGVSDILVGVDAATGETTTQVAIDGLITSMAAEEEGLWLSVSRVGTGNAVLAADPVTAQIDRTIEGLGGYLAAAGGRVWVLGTGDNRGSLLTSIDAATGETLGSLQIPDGAPLGIEATPTAVWVLTAAAGDSGSGANVMLIDPSSMTLVRDFGSIAAPTAMATAGDSLWVQGWLSTFDPDTDTGFEDGIVPVRIDAETLTVTHGAPMSAEAVFRPFAASEQGAWFLGRSASGSFVSSIAGATMDTGPRLALQTPVVDVTLDRATSTMWVLNLEESLTQIVVGSSRERT